MADKAEKAEKKADAQKAGRGGALLRAILENKVLLLGGVVAAQAVLAIAITQLLIVPRLGVGAAAAGAVAAAPAEPRAGVLVSLQEVIASLRTDGRTKSYVRTTISVEVQDAAAAAVVEERLAQLRDTVIMTVSQRTAADLTSPEGTHALRDELRDRLAAHLPAGSLLNIYFSDLVVQ